jgi:hypothetical protein
MNGKIFNTIKEAEAFNREEAINRGCTGTTEYWFRMVELTSETTLTKEEYANLWEIPQTITNEEGESVNNPAYDELDETITVKKYALVSDEIEGSVNIDEFVPVAEEE